MEPLISLRLMDHHKDERLLDDLIQVLRKRSKSIDEVWFAIDYGFPKLETHMEYARKMAEAAKRLRAEGFGCSIQVSNTIGHGDYLKYLDYSGVTWQRMVGHDGSVAGYANCPRDPALHDYLRKIMRAYAEWQPDSIWIDDDLRMWWHGSVGYGCFCERCLKLFNDRYDGSFSRESLVKALNDKQDGLWREKWIRFNQDALADIAKTVMDAATQAAPNVKGALQQAGFDLSIYNGTELTAVYEAIADATGKPARCRAGGGFYGDHAPRQVIDKALTIALQIERLPACVDRVCAEIENGTDAALGKSSHGVVLESSLYLAYGCDALSYAILMCDNEPAAFYDDVLHRMELWRPYWERMTQRNKGTRPGGLGIAFGPRHYARQIAEGEELFHWAHMNFGSVYQMCFAGLPMNWDTKRSPVTLLHPDAVDGLSDSEIIDILSGGVLTDGRAIERINERGLSRYTSVIASPAPEMCCCETMTGDEINKGNVGRRWSCSQQGYEMSSPDKDARVIAEYTRLDGERFGASALVTETPVGGRLAVFGCGLWNWEVNTARRDQLVRAADWVSTGRLPALLTSATQAAIVPRVDETGAVRSVTVLNATIDRSNNITLLVRKPVGRRAVFAAPCRGDVMLETAGGTDELRVTISSMEPWSIGTVFFEDREQL